MCLARVGRSGRRLSLDWRFWGRWSWIRRFARVGIRGCRFRWRGRSLSWRRTFTPLPARLRKRLSRLRLRARMSWKLLRIRYRVSGESNRWLLDDRTRLDGGGENGGRGAGYGAAAGYSDGHY